MKKTFTVILSILLYFSLSAQTIKLKEGEEFTIINTSFNTTSVTDSKGTAKTHNVENYFRALLKTK